jgi:hypothetical protein
MSLNDSLDTLNALIAKAEAKLRKIPGAFHDDAYIYLGRLDPANDCLEFYLRMHGDSLVVVDDGEFCKPLKEMQIRHRIDAAKEIPNLIEVANRECESVAKEIDALNAELSESI